MRPNLLTLAFALAMTAPALGDFQEIVPTDENEGLNVEAKVGEAGMGLSSAEIEAAEAQKRTDAEALRKCAKNYDYSLKKRTLELRLQQAKLKHEKVVANTAALFVKNEALGKERRAETQKELDAVTGELRKLDDGCLGRPSAPVKDASTGAPNDAAPVQKP